MLLHVDCHATVADVMPSDLQQHVACSMMYSKIRYNV